MRLMLRKHDGTLGRPAPTGSVYDFSHANSGDLVIEDGEAIHEVGAYVMACADWGPPPTVYSYEASLFTLDDRLLVRAIQRDDALALDRISLRLSDDGGRTWQLLTVAPPLEAWRLVDEVEA